MRKASPLLFIWLFVLTLCTIGSSGSWALSINLVDPGADFFDDGIDPCPRGDKYDDCWVSSYLDTAKPANEYWEVFDKGWNAWNDSQPAGEKWTLDHGPALEGYLDIIKFDTFNNCSGTGGVEVKAKFYRLGLDPTEWYWAQALHDNYEVGPTAPPHNSPAAAARYEMDVDPAGDFLPPLYPFQYVDGRFYDRPGAYCHHNDTVFFDAVALIVTYDRPARTLTAYEGFSYGWEFPCVHIPDPASLTLAILGAGTVALLRRRRALR